MPATTTKVDPRIAALRARLTAFDWDIDNDTDEFVATVGPDDFRLPLALTYRDLREFSESGETNEIEGLRVLLEKTGKSDVLDRLEALSLATFAAILNKYGEVLAQVQDATLPE